MKNSKGILLVVSGPSGVGKGTICKEFLKKSDIFYSVSATTRTARAGEVDGVNYFFKTEDEFSEMIDKKEFLEWATFCGNYYGTPKHVVEEKLQMGIDVILEIDVQGAMQVRSNYPEGVFVFILPPSMEELENRIRGRKTESEEVINTRLQKAQKEIKTANKYNYLVLNDNLDEAVNSLNIILSAEKLRTERSKNLMEKVCG